jgi:hypothetical protein
MLEFAPVAFVGTLTDRQPAELGELGGQNWFVFEVETVLAGDAPAQAWVLSADNGAACGIEAGIGQRLGVFASLDGEVLSSSLCSVTDPDLAIKALGPGKAPLGGSGSPGEQTQAPSTFDWPALGLGAGGLTLVAVVWLLSRRK